LQLLWFVATRSLGSYSVCLWQPGTLLCH